MAKQKFSPRQSGVLLDVVHVVLGAAVILMAGFAIADPDNYKVFFPIIFLLAAVINAVTAWFHFKNFPRIRKKQALGWVYTLTGILMIALFVVSAVSIWGNN